MDSFKMFNIIFWSMFIFMIVGIIYSMVNNQALIDQCKNGGGTVIQDRFGYFDGCVTGSGQVNIIRSY